MKILYSLLVAFGILLLALSVVLLIKDRTNQNPSSTTLWQVQSIDAMKYSRDTARVNQSNQSVDSEIDKMMKDIASTGATHVGIGTPYDSEFVPYLTRWVQSARKHDLKVWFRGNFAGWEGWFNYPKISTDQHEKLVSEFINKNADLFEDGDIFSPCPECENGGSGDPRQTGEVAKFRKFLIKETEISNNLFKSKGLKVSANYHSMNADVAMLIMDKQTTKALGGIVVIDHYAANPEEVSAKINEIALSSGGKIVLGEFGAPIPDLNGNLTEPEQAEWLDKLLNSLIENKNLIGLNYWVNKGGSTALWTDGGRPKEAVSTLTKFYKHTSVNPTSERH